MWKRKKDRAKGQVSTEAAAADQQCPGSCFHIDVVPRQLQQNDESALQSFSNTALTEQASPYADISSWQTRLIGLLPSPDSRAIVKADLLAVDLIAGEGVVVTSTKENLAYEALSYCWGVGPRDRVLDLNGHDFAVSSNLYAALRKLRSRSRTRYLWVDAICINQSDNDEKSVQVVAMLKIFQKAAKIHTWLGESSEDSDLAVASLQGSYSLLREQLAATAHMNHQGSCLVQLQAIHTALCNFFARDWFRRTWIRQEVYAARKIEVHCGEQSIAWGSLWSGKRLLERIEKFPNTQCTHRVNIDRLLEELEKNTEQVQPGQQKALRSFFEILFSSRHYQVTEPKDIVYASLGMCGVPASAASSDASTAMIPTIFVDYKKTLAEVLQDVLVYMLQTRSIAKAFHFREPCAQTLTDLPSWVLDWQHGCCSEDEAKAIELAVSRHSSPRIGHIYTWCPLSPDTRVTWTKPPLDDTWHANEAKVPFFAPADQRKWEVPVPLGGGIMELPARALDYVAELTDYTCDLEWLVGDYQDAMNLYMNATLGTTAERLAKCKGKRRFDPERDHRRLAILRTPANTHVALVPANTEVGDFLVAIAPDILPLVLSPQVRDPPRASEVYYYDDPPSVAAPNKSKIASIFRGKDSFGLVGEYLAERRQRVEKAVQVFGPHFTMKGPAFAIQGYDFFTRPESFQNYHELQVERNWLRPIQRFLVH